MKLLAPYKLHRGVVRCSTSIPRIDWTHPLTKGLLLYHYDTGMGGTDLVGHRAWSLLSANQLSRTSSLWGTSYKYPSSTADGVQYAGDALLRILPPFAWASGFMRTVSATESDANFFGRAANSGASQPFFNWAIIDRVLNTANNIGIQVNSAGTGTQSIGVSLSLNAYHCVVASAPSTTTVNWWADGTAQTDMTALTIQDVTTGDNIFIGTDLGGPGGFQGQVFWGAFWNRTLSAAEARQLTQNPYCFLIYREDEMWARRVGSSGAVTPSTLAPGPVWWEGSFETEIVSY